MPTVGVAVIGGHAGNGGTRKGFIRRAGAVPRCEVFGAGVPGREPIQCRPGGRFPAGAIAFVEVGGEEGNNVQPGYRGGRGDVQMCPFRGRR